MFCCPWNYSVPRQLCGQWRRWLKVALGQSCFPDWGGLGAGRPEQGAVEGTLPGRGGSQVDADVFITSSTVLTLFPSPLPQIPSFLLCYAFSSQRSLQSVAENDATLRIVLSSIVIKCMFLLPFLSRPTPFQGPSTG